MGSSNLLGTEQKAVGGRRRLVCVGCNRENVLSAASIAAMAFDEEDNDEARDGRAFYEWIV